MRLVQAPLSSGTVSAQQAAEGRLWLLCRLSPALSLGSALSQNPVRNLFPGALGLEDGDQQGVDITGEVCRCHGLFLSLESVLHCSVKGSTRKEQFSPKI